MSDALTELLSPKTEPPTEPKRRTITLTNRAPVRIIEDNWPIIAEGSCGYDCDGAPYGWDITIRVRREKLVSLYLARYLVHARYSTFNDDERDEHNQTVRVGRLLGPGEGVWKHILAIGDELRERIANENLRKHVIYAVDDCFAKLPPHNE